MNNKLAIFKELGVKKVFLYPFALIFVITLRLISNFLKVNIHTIINSRIGHFATNTELSILSVKNSKDKALKREINLFCFQSPKSSNGYLEKMWLRCQKMITGDWSWVVLDIAKRLARGEMLTPTTGNDSAGLLLNNIPVLSFESREIDLGKSFLESIGIDAEQPFVCLNVRDAKFLQESEPISWSKTRDWSYHNHRDTDIQDYVLAAETIANMGYPVFRMGAIVAKPLTTSHPLVFDYATNGMRTEFLDMYLGAHCKFCISTGTGWDSVPQIFRRPSMYVNLAPMILRDCIVRDLTVYPKILMDRKTGTELTLNQIFSKDLHENPFHWSNFKKAEVAIRDLDSEELVEAVTEMVARVEGTFVETPEQKQMHAKFNYILSNHPKLQPTPNHFPIRAKFASCFLSNYPNFLD
jgi:putative glycosyltransferase (TIGR04372 family)